MLCIYSEYMIYFYIDYMEYFYYLNYYFIIQEFIIIFMIILVFKIIQELCDILCVMQQGGDVCYCLKFGFFGWK